jgi:hypothetical protein
LLFRLGHHLPFIGKLVALLLASSEENAIVVFRFSSVACVERRDRGKSKVAWAGGFYERLKIGGTKIPFAIGMKMTTIRFCWPVRWMERSGH